VRYDDDDDDDNDDDDDDDDDVHLCLGVGSEDVCAQVGVQLIEGAGGVHTGAV
jgi:hypothetical protein